MPSLRAFFVVVLVSVTIATDVAGQESVLVSARAAATSGRRGDALSLLERHLETTPRDVDARLLYGLVLSWEGRYDDARPQLQQVLTQTPAYTDARVALMNVEYWSGQTQEAQNLADQILASEPGNVTARTIRERLAASSRPWWVKTSYYFDSFDDGREKWHEYILQLTRQTPIGAAILRGSHAERWDDDDQLIEAEFYPRFRAGSYAFLSAGVATSHSLYPQYRAAFDVYQSVGRGYEISGGARYLQFEELTQIYVGTFSKYWGNWMFTGKAYFVPIEAAPNSESFYGGFRRYFGGDGTSYVGMTYGHGFSREEVRTVEDLVMLNSRSVSGEIDWLYRSRWRISISGGVSREERADNVPLWQTRISGGVAMQF